MKHGFRRAADQTRSTSNLSVFDIGDCGPPELGRAGEQASGQVAASSPRSPPSPQAVDSGNPDELNRAGDETALAFGRRGDTVYATMRDPSIDDRLRDAVARESLPVVIRGLDVTDGTAIRDVVAGIVAERGGIDVLVNNAGIGFVEAIEEADEARARLVWETNFWGPIHLFQAVLPYMRAQRAGVIVNLSTFGTRFPGGGWLAMYGGTKQAMSRMSESLNAELVGDRRACRCDRTRNVRDRDLRRSRASVDRPGVALRRRAGTSGR